MWKKTPPDVELAQAVCGLSAIAFWIGFVASKLLAGLSLMVFLLSGAYVLVSFAIKYLQDRNEHKDE